MWDMCIIWGVWGTCASSGGVWGTCASSGGCGGRVHHLGWGGGGVFIAVYFQCCIVRCLHGYTVVMFDGLNSNHFEHELISGTPWSFLYYTPWSTPQSDASVCRTKECSKSWHISTGPVHRCRFKASNHSAHSKFHNRSLGCSFLVSSVSGAAMVAYSGMNLR